MRHSSVRPGWIAPLLVTVLFVALLGTTALGQYPAPAPKPAPTPSTAPIPTAPANGAARVAVPVTMTWNVPGKDSYIYEVLVSTNNGFTNTAADKKGLLVRTVTISSLAAGTLYYWKINSLSLSGTSATSAVWSFTTAGTPPPAPPSAPILVGPSSGSINVQLNTKLVWYAVVGAASYNVQVAATNAFANPLVLSQSNITGTSLDLSAATGTTSLLKINTQYFWRVQAVSKTAASGWSNIWSFTTVNPPQPPAVPTLLSPLSGAAGVTVVPDLVWNKADRANLYSVQVSTNNGFTATVFSVNNLTATSVVVISSAASGSGGPVLAQNKQYFWRVQAINNAGSSAWSAVSSFTTVAPPTLPGVPVLNTPFQKATNVPVPTILTWKPADRAVNYSVQVSSLLDFSKLAFSTAGIAGTSVMVGTSTGSAVTGAPSNPVLLPNTMYYWRVMGTNGSGSGAWSAVWCFTTASASNGTTTAPGK
jgi:hypothetical protein